MSRQEQTIRAYQTGHSRGVRELIREDIATTISDETLKEQFCSNMTNTQINLIFSKSCTCRYSLLPLLPRFNSLCQNSTTAGKIKTRIGKKNMNEQNQFITDQCFTKENGNTKYDRQCVQTIFSISNNRYTRLHVSAIQTSKNLSFETIPKADIPNHRLKDVVIPVEELAQPILFWQNLPDDAEVQLRTNSIVHGLKGKKIK